MTTPKNILTLVAPMSRILLRYAAGPLLTLAAIPDDVARQLVNDPDMIALVGLALMLAIEGYYYLAKKNGWPT